MTLNSLIQVNDGYRARQYDFGTSERAVKDEEDSDERHTNGLEGESERWGKSRSRKAEGAIR